VLCIMTIWPSTRGLNVSDWIGAGSWDRLLGRALSADINKNGQGLLDIGLAFEANQPSFLPYHPQIIKA
jgi:hypothetical protein